MKFSSLEAAGKFGRFEAVFQKGQAKAPTVSINWDDCDLWDGWDIWDIWDIWDKSFSSQISQISQKSH